MGDRCDRSHPNRILVPLPAPGIAIFAAADLNRSRLDVFGPLELHFHGWRFLSCFLRSLRPGRVLGQRHRSSFSDSVFDVLRVTRPRTHRSRFSQGKVDLAMTNVRTTLETPAEQI